MVPDAASEEAPLLVHTKGGLGISYKGRMLYSGREPPALPCKTASACDRGPARLHLVFSPLLGYGLAELAAAMGEGSKILCVESDPLLARITRDHLPTELVESGLLAFVAGRDIGALLSQAKKMGTFRACRGLALSGGAALDPEFYGRATAVLASEIENSWRNRASLMLMGRLWAKNIFANLAALGELSLEPFPRSELPALVCGAGPSLEDALPLIRENRGDLFVIACDTALGTLLASGIRPDLVVCLEAQAHNLADFTPLGDAAHRLAVDISSHPASLRVTRGPKCLSLVRITDSPFLDRVAAFATRTALPFMAMPPLGSVGVHAAAMAVRLCFAPVFLCGLDFSYESGKTHARGAPALVAAELGLGRLSRWPSQYGASLRERAIPAPCPPLADGRILRSDPVLLSYAKLCAELAEESGAGTLYDIRGRGPGIGARPLSLADAAALIRRTARLAREQSITCSQGPQRQAGPDSAAEHRGDEARAFIAQEAARLRDIRAVLKGSLVIERARLISMIAESDYLYWSFPDAARASEPPQDFLNRLLPELDWWGHRLEGIGAARHD